jgi:hypothetical protein
MPHLDERSARLVLAAEARALGHGGIAAVAPASGSSRSRVQQGIAELEAGGAPLGRVRRAGGGRLTSREFVHIRPCLSTYAIVLSLM